MKRRTSLRRRPFVITIALGATAAVAALPACSGAVALNPPIPQSDAGADGATTSDAGAGCPSTPPTSGTACGLADGAECQYAATSACGVPEIFFCSRGQWSQAIVNPPPPICPATQPTVGDSCCLPGTITCPYGDCFGHPTSEFQCLNGSWIVTRPTCNPPPPFDAGSADAGSADAASTD